VAALLRIIEKYEKLKEKYQDISKITLTN
jgi:hypothetical protein